MFLKGLLVEVKIEMRQNVNHINVSRNLQDNA